MTKKKKPKKKVTKQSLVELLKKTKASAIKLGNNFRAAQTKLAEAQRQRTAELDRKKEQLINIKLKRLEDAERRITLRENYERRLADIKRRQAELEKRQNGGWY